MPIISNLTYIINGRVYDASSPVLADMEFQTNKNGTFAPSFTIDVGTLIWDYGDGSPLEETNSPSHLYVDGTTKDVKVYANTVTGSSVISNVDFAGENIVGDLDFSGLPTTLNGPFLAFSNALLTDCIFKASGNTSDNFRVFSCNLTGALDLSGFTLSAQLFVRFNPLLTDITFSGSGNSFTTFFDINTNDLTGTLDLSGITFNTGVTIAINGNSNLTGITFSASGNVSDDFNVFSCGLTGTLDLSSFTLSGKVYIHSNSSLTGITFSSSGNTGSDFRVYSNNLTGTLDLSGFVFNGGQVYFYSNANLTGVTFSGSGNTSSYMIGRFCNLTGVVDVSGFTNAGGVEMQGNSAMTGITWGTIGQFTLLSVNADAFIQAEVDEILNIIQVYSTGTAPTSNLSLMLNGGTNSTPSATGLTDKGTIQTNYTNAGFTATIVNN